MKLWDKGYKLDEKIENYTVGQDYLLDMHLVKYDCIASIAHVKMLFKLGYLKNQEKEKLITGLTKIQKLVEKDQFKIEKSDEDVHTAIEKYLTKEYGEIGKKIHMLRSRNDQVLTALRLFYIDKIKEIKKNILNLNESLKKFLKKNKKVEYPGFTHTRKAMPSSIDLWCDAFIQSNQDNLIYLEFVLEILSSNPLGSAAGYGVQVKIDRDLTKKLLNFKKIQNPIYAQFSRGKFEAIILSFLSSVMFDLNKISSDLILFSMPTFGFFNLSNEFLTGSSIMPQKKNPDVLELIRANYHVVLSNEFQTKSLISNLITGYHRDFQILKKPIFDSLFITSESLELIKLIFDNLKVDKNACKKHLTKELYATKKVYDLVEKGMSFRDAYKKISKEFK